jgi:hypothetical protein
LDLSLNLDIKSALFHSLGYIYLNIFYEFNINDSSKQAIINKSLIFYNEVKTESL